MADLGVLEDVPGAAPERPGRPGADPGLRPGRLRAERIPLLATAALAVAVPAVAALDLAVPGRALLALAFVLTVPGVPLVAGLRLPDPLLACSLAGALSIATALLTATAALLTGTWDPVRWAWALALVHLAATAWVLRRGPRTAGPGARAPGRPAARELRIRAVCAAALVAAVGLWWLAAGRVDLDAAGASGLIGVVGWPYLAALVLVAGVAAAQLVRRAPDGVVLAAAALVLALVLFAFANVADGAAGVPTGWRHVGFQRFISANEASFYGLDARASWPAFFAAAAQLVHLAGVADASAFLQLAPFFYNAAALVPLLVVARCVTGSGRIAWLSVFVYLGANWYQQDYFAPQATAFLLYLTVLATLLWSAAAAWRSRAADRPGGPRPERRRLRSLLAPLGRRPPLPAGLDAGRSVALEGVLLLLATAVVVTHQLTPVTLVLTLLVFVVTGYTRFRRLWLVVALLFVGWFSYGASDFWTGHLSAVVGDVGQVGANLDQAVTSRVVGDPTYQFMQQVRLGWSLVHVLLAVTGLGLILRRPDARLIALLAASAGSLVLLQSYGGEVVLRVFVFAAPLLAPLAAIALHRLLTWAPRGLPARRRQWLALAALAVVLTGYGAAGTATRGVNVSFERVSADDVRAARVLWANLREGDTVGLLYPAGAYPGDRYGEWSTVWLREERCELPPEACALTQLPRFVLLGRTQDAALTLVEGSAPGASRELADALLRSGRYEVVYRGADAQLLVLDGPR